MAGPVTVTKFNMVFVSKMVDPIRSNEEKKKGRIQTNEMKCIREYGGPVRVCADVDTLCRHIPNNVDAQNQ